MIKEMDIHDEFTLLSSSESVDAIAKKLKEVGETGVILVTDVGEVVGFISQNEILEVVSKGGNPAEIKANEIMNTDFVEVLEDEMLGNILPIIAQSYPNAIVVIKENRDCVGFFSRNDYKDALATMGVYDQSREPETADDWQTKGIAMSAQGEKEEAEKCYEKSVETSSNRERAWERLAKKLENLNKVKDALLCYNKVVTINKDNDSAFLNRGKLYSKQKTQNLAIHCYQLALSVNPNNVDALMNLGIEYSNSGKLEEALEQFEKIQEINGESSEIWYRKGNAHDHAKKYEEAIKCYDKAIELDDKFEDAWFDKGVALNNIERFEEALICMKEILKINPNNDNVQEAITRYKETGSFGFV